MPWESIGSTSTGSMPHEEAWIVFTLGIARKYIEFVCGEPPPGNKLEVMWHEHGLGTYPTLGVWSDYAPDTKYVHACERALEVFDDAIEWHELRSHFGEVAFEEEDDKGERDET